MAFRTSCRLLHKPASANTKFLAIVTSSICNTLWSCSFSFLEKCLSLCNLDTTNVTCLFPGTKQRISQVPSPIAKDVVPSLQWVSTGYQIAASTPRNSLTYQNTRLWCRYEAMKPKPHTHHNTSLGENYGVLYSILYPSYHFVDVYLEIDLSWSTIQKWGPGALKTKFKSFSFPWLAICDKLINVDVTPETSLSVHFPTTHHAFKLLWNRCGPLVLGLNSLQGHDTSVLRLITLLDHKNAPMHNTELHLQTFPQLLSSHTRIQLVYRRLSLQDRRHIFLEHNIVFVQDQLPLIGSAVVAGWRTDGKASNGSNALSVRTKAHYHAQETHAFEYHKLRLVQGSILMKAHWASHCRIGRADWLTKRTSLCSSNTSFWSAVPELSYHLLQSLLLSWHLHFRIFIAFPLWFPPILRLKNYNCTVAFAIISYNGRTIPVRQVRHYTTTIILPTASPASTPQQCHSLGHTTNLAFYLTGLFVPSLLLFHMGNSKK